MHHPTHHQQRRGHNENQLQIDGYRTGGRNRIQRTDLRVRGSQCARSAADRGGGQQPACRRRIGQRHRERPDTDDVDRRDRIVVGRGDDDAPRRPRHPHRYPGRDRAIGHRQHPGFVRGVSSHRHREQRQPGGHGGQHGGRCSWQHRRGLECPGFSPRHGGPGGGHGQWQRSVRCAQWCLEYRDRRAGRQRQRDRRIEWRGGDGDRCPWQQQPDWCAEWRSRYGDRRSG